MPIRIQRKRTKGWKIPSNAVYVGRPTKWGNPFSIMSAYADANRELQKIDDIKNQTPIECANNIVGFAKAIAVQNYKSYLQDHPELVELAKKELRGKDLVCWCAIGGHEPCHADILLKIANQ